MVRGKVRHFDPETNKRTISPRNLLDGDHILLKKQFKNTIAEHEDKIGRSLTKSERKEILQLMNSKENLRPMLSGHNRAKGALDAASYAKTPKGMLAHPDYISDMAKKQDAILALLNLKLGAYS